MVENYHVHRSLTDACQLIHSAQAKLEGDLRIPVIFQEQGDVHIAEAMIETLGDGAEKISRHYQWLLG